MTFFNYLIINEKNSNMLSEMNADAALSSKTQLGSTGVFSKLVHISSQSLAVYRVRNLFACDKVLDETKIATIL